MREAAQNTLGKGSKIETATDAVFAHQFHQMSQDELDTVADYKMKRLGIGSGGSGSGERHSDLIIADQMKFESPQNNSNGLLTALLGAGVALLGMNALRPDTPATAPPPVTQQPPAVVQPHPPPTFPPGTDTFNKIKPLPGE